MNDFEELTNSADFLKDALRALGPRSKQENEDGGFSLVEHLWHLADLEQEGFGARIARLRDEENPVLPDFDGDRIARERNYKSRDAAEGLDAFRAARQANLAAMRALTSEDWSRSGHLEDFGPITLRELPKLMREHDASHHAEITALVTRS